MASSSPLRHLRRFSTSISISKPTPKLRSENDLEEALKPSVPAGRLAAQSVSRYAPEITVRNLPKSRRFSDVDTFIETHRTDPKIKDETYVSTLIRSYGRDGMFDHATWAHENMEALGTPRSVLSFNALLAACNNSKLFEKAPQLFDEIPKRFEFSPDGMSYRILVKSYCGKGLTEKAVETMHEMEKKGFEVTAATLTTIIDAMYKNGKGEEAEKLWEAMKNKGCKIDSVAYNLRIENRHGGRPEAVKAMIEEMIESGVKPDTSTYNHLVICHCKAGNFGEAKKVFDELEEKGLRPNPATFKILISELCGAGYFDRAQKVFKRSMLANMVTDFTTARVLVEGLAGKKMTKEAKKTILAIKKGLSPAGLVPWKKVEVSLGLSAPDFRRRKKVPDHGGRVASP